MQITLNTYISWTRYIVFIEILSNYFKIAALRITLEKTSLFIVDIYRTHGNLEEGLEVVTDYLGKHLPRRKHTTVLIGDINIGCIDERNNYFQLKNTFVWKAQD